MDKGSVTVGVGVTNQPPVEQPDTIRLLLDHAIIERPSLGKAAKEKFPDLCERVLRPPPGPLACSLRELVGLCETLEIPLGTVSIDLHTEVQRGMPSFAERLRELRQRAKLTQMQLAEKAKTTKSAVVQYESGRRVPSVTGTAALAKALGGDLSLFADVDYGHREEGD